MDVLHIVDAAIAPILIGVGAVVCIWFLWLAHRQPAPSARSLLRWAAVVSLSYVMLGVGRVFQPVTSSLTRALLWTAIALMWIGIVKIYRKVRTGAVVAPK